VLAANTSADPKTSDSVNSAIIVKEKVVFIISPNIVIGSNGVFLKSICVFLVQKSQATL